MSVITFSGTEIYTVRNNEMNEPNYISGISYPINTLFGFLLKQYQYNC